jgi:hypothetical protein
MNECKGKDRNGLNCHFFVTDNSYFCKYHQYMENYTNLMLTNLTLCSGCKKQYYLPDGGSCDKCKTRGEATRQKTKDNVVFCVKQDCKFKKSKDNEFCGKHQLYYFYSQLEKKRKRACADANRGCRVELEMNYGYSKCDKCLGKARDKDNKKTAKLQQCNLNNDNNVKLCTKCGHENDDLEYAHCDICRLKQKVQDRKREGRKRDWKKELDNNPERAEKKKQWKVDNYDKIVSYWVKYCSNRIKNEDDEYWKNNTENHTKWVRENIDKMREQRENNKQNPKIKLGNYTYRANKYSILWELTDLNAMDLMKDKCFYCGKKDYGKLNGIDRRNNERGYTNVNSVSCCSMCNYIKGCTDENIYVERCEHILTNLGKIDGLIEYDNFPDSISTSYINYKYRAKKKKFSFNLRYIDYADLVLGNCYLCGKKASIIHKNGIDRIDNNKEYVIEDLMNKVKNNCASCCTECNYMKGVYSYDQFIEKLEEVYNFYNSKSARLLIKREKYRNQKSKYRENLRNKFGDDKYKEYLREQTHNYRMKKGTNGRNEKKTKEQIKEAAKLRKQKQRQSMKDKYGDDTWKAIRAKEVAIERAKKTGNIDNEEKFKRELDALKK